MGVVDVLVADADDAERLRVPRLRSCILSALEFCFDLNIDILPIEVINHVVDLLTLQGNGVATPFP